MLRCFALLLAVSWVLAPPARSQAPDATHRVVGPAADLAHLSTDAWRAAVAVRQPGSAGDELLTQLAAFAGTARLAQDLLSRHGGQRDEARAVMQSLDTLAGRVDRALSDTRADAGVRRSWDEVRASLVTLKDRQSGATPTPAPTPAPTPTAPTTPAPPARDPDMPWVTITEHSWSGTFTPDLILRGRFEGRGLDRAELTVTDASGKVVHRDDTSLTDEIRKQATSATASATVTWSYRVDDDEMSDGRNTVRVTVRDRRGNAYWTERAIDKRLTAD